MDSYEIHLTVYSGVCLEFFPSHTRSGFCMKLLTQVSEEIGLEGEKKRLQPPNSESPQLILSLEDHFNNFLQEIAKGSHYPKMGRR